MTTHTRSLSAIVAFLFLMTISTRQGKTASDLINQFDKNGDKKLDKAEFAAALKSLGIPVKTVAGAEKAETVREEVNQAIKDAKQRFKDQPRYKKRAAEAQKLLG